MSGRRTFYTTDADTIHAACHAMQHGRELPRTPITDAAGNWIAYGRIYSIARRGAEVFEIVCEEWKPA